MEGIEAPSERSGRNRLRPGWGIVVWLTIFALTTVVIGIVVGIVMIFTGIRPPEMLHGVLARDSVAFGEAFQLIAIAVATLSMALIERRNLAAYGFGLRRMLPRLAQGVIIGSLMFSLLIAALWMLHAIDIERVAASGANYWTLGLEWGAAFLMLGTAEEFAFRGYFLQTLARGFNFRWATVISSLLFMLVHASNPNESACGLLTVFLSGVLFAFSIWKTGTIWWAVGFHTAWDWSQSFLYGVPDSGLRTTESILVSHSIGPAWLNGGATGPEGSILALPIYVIAAFILVVSAGSADRRPDAAW